MSCLKLRLNPAPNESLDGTPKGPQFLQLQKGQRVASDDILLAATAKKIQPSARDILDLGSGKGSVAIMYLAVSPAAQGVGLEAYAPSFELAVRNRTLNNLEQQFLPILCDLRSSCHILGRRTFDLITGAPPFIPKGHGLVPQNEQRRYGRFEERGGVEAYCQAIARHLDRQSGQCVILMDAKNETRTHRSFGQAGLTVNRVINVYPRPNQPPIYQIFGGSYIRQTCETYHLTMRGPAGTGWSSEYSALRQLISL